MKKILITGGAGFLASPFSTEPSDFNDRARQYVVENMLAQIDNVLIDGRQPELRLLAVLQRFLAHPIVKAVVNTFASRQLGIDQDELKVVTHVLSQLKAAIAMNKQQRSSESLQVYQTVMNLISPPANARLQRATCSLFSLSSAKGLQAAQLRLVARRVDIESGITESSQLFAPVSRKTRSDWIAGESMRRNAAGFWDSHTRVSSCVKHTKVMEDKSVHVVHWLEVTVAEMYYNFHSSGFCISEDGVVSFTQGGHYYPTQLLVRHVPEDMTSLRIRSEFSRFNPFRVNPMSKQTYFYVVFRSAQDCTDALSAATAGLSFSATVTRRPLMGQTAFENERPCYVLDVKESSCVCVLCRCFVLMFQGFLQFLHWEDCCQPVAELVEDIRNAAHPFSPSILNILGLLLCPKNPSTDCYQKKCSYGACEQCGWARKMGDLEVVDVLQDGEDDAKELFVTFKAYETVKIDTTSSSRDDEKSPPSIRSALLPQSVPPSEFLSLF